MATQKHLLSLLVLFSVSQTANAFCFKEAEQRYGIPNGLLKAIANTESSLNPQALSHTNDIGLMQINKSWVPYLSRNFGISERKLWDPCTNVMVGAWILANEFKTKGRNWNAIGAYNARCAKLKGINCYVARQKYSMKVWKNWKQLKSL